MPQKLAALSLVAVFLLPLTARAHAQYKPFSINRYTEISFNQNGIRISYLITVGDLPAQKLRKRADDDHDGLLSKTEYEPLLTWVRGLIARGLNIRLDGKIIKTDPGPGKLELVTEKVKLFAPMHIAFQFDIACPPGRHDLVYHDSSRLPSLEQTELFFREAGWASLTRSSLSRSGPKLTRRMFWNEGKQAEPVMIRFLLFEEHDRKQQPADSPDQTESRLSSLIDDTGPLKRALSDESLGFFGMLAVLGLAFLLGSLHALSPGHGKTLVAAYLVGTRGKIRHAVLLGLIVTFTHVFSVVILGLIALWASEKVLPERLAPWLSLAAGGIVFLMGLWMVFTRRKRHHHHDHQHGDHDHEHDHGHLNREVKWSELLILGISGGMVPCLSATVVLLFAVYLGKTANGLLLILAFSLGLAATLIILGILVVRGRKLIERFTKNSKAKKLVEFLPILSATAVTIIGLLMVVFAGMDI
ncbi:MAG: sulfite exporter TauE/SafE family protein [Deltaproteobacteria bacterium]|nr:sulfite exporter TauE/SafE family protein [Deltaproteobacteria bacterium]